MRSLGKVDLKIPPHRRIEVTRCGIAIILDLVAGGISLMLAPGPYSPGGDFALWPLPAAREILAGGDPYRLGFRIG
jgi:hypothetical protein